jgi:hypothetical protein
MLARDNVTFNPNVLSQDKQKLSRVTKLYLKAQTKNLFVYIKRCP